MRLSPAQLRARADLAREQYADCHLCGHHCGVDRRRGPAGRCQEGDGLYLGGASLHFGEEPPLVGKPGGPRHGSGLILIGGCNLACRSCETADMSLQRRNLVPVSEEQLAGVLLDLQRRGAANLNFVTPTHVLPALLAGLSRAAEAGLDLPVVWNCGGYESLEALRLLEGVVDVYLPDAKYGGAEEGLALSGCADYPRVLAECLAEMFRQVGPLRLDQHGLAAAGVIVRHLVLPAGQARPEVLMQLLADVSPDLWVNVLSQYRPVHEAKLFPVIARRPLRSEIDAALRAAAGAGLLHVLLDGQPAAS